MRIMGVRIPTQDEINHIQEEVSIDDDNSPAPENIPREPTSSNIFDDIFSNWGQEDIGQSISTAMISKSILKRNQLVTAMQCKVN